MRNAYWKVFWRAEPPTRGIEAARTHNRQRVCTRTFPSLSRARTFAGRVPEASIALWVDGVLLRMA